MTYRGLLIAGCGGHARSVADIALDLGVGELRFVDMHAHDSEAIAGFDVLRDWPTGIDEGWAAFAALGASAARMRAVEAIRARGFALATLISRRAYVGHAALVGEGTLVAHGAHVGPFARIGEGVIVNSAAVIDHESIVGDYSHVAVNATVAGRCRIGRNAFVGAAAVVIDGIVVADDVTIGAGTVVVRDLDRAGIYAGAPARLLRSTS